MYMKFVGNKDPTCTNWNVYYLLSTSKFFQISPDLNEIVMVVVVNVIEAASYALWNHHFAYHYVLKPESGFDHVYGAL